MVAVVSMVCGGRLGTAVVMITFQLSSQISHHTRTLHGQTAILHLFVHRQLAS